MAAHHSRLWTRNNQSKSVRPPTLHYWSYVALRTLFNIHSSAFGSLRYAWWMVIVVLPFMLSAEAVYTIVDKHKLLMSSLGVTVSTMLIHVSNLSYNMAKQIEKGVSQARVRLLPLQYLILSG